MTAASAIAPSLDDVFGCLADRTRRDILRRVAGKDLSVTEVAKPYGLTLAAISKHLKVLEGARLVVKRRQGKQQIVSLAPNAFMNANEYLDFYKQLSAGRLDALERFLKEDQDAHH